MADPEQREYSSVTADTAVKNDSSKQNVHKK